MDKKLIKVQKGVLFEHFVILELFRRASLPGADFKLFYWKTLDGAEVDCVIEQEDGSVIPLEIKATEVVTLGKIRGLLSFMKDHPAKEGYVVYLGDRPYKLKDNITVIPWWMV